MPSSTPSDTTDIHSRLPPRTASCGGLKIVRLLRRQRRHMRLVLRCRLPRSPHRLPSPSPRLQPLLPRRRLPLCPRHQRRLLRRWQARVARRPQQWTIRRRGDRVPSAKRLRRLPARCRVSGPLTSASGSPRSPFWLLRSCCGGRRRVPWAQPRRRILQRRRVPPPRRLSLRRRLLLHRSQWRQPGRRAPSTSSSSRRVQSGRASRLTVARRWRGNSPPISASRSVPIARS